ncbi:MAG: endolytic transglycosylase MltG [bacterium]|nr:endolytic transglycosylase MltG [bacterium]
MRKLRKFLVGFIHGSRKKIVAPAAVLLFLFLIVLYFAFELRAVTAAGDIKIIEIKNGYGFRKIVNIIANEGLIRSRIAFGTLAVLTGSAGKLKSGIYQLNSAMTSSEILRELISGSHREITVTIPEGTTVYGIGKILSGAGVLQAGEFVDMVQKKNLEGKLFPDTYRFFMGSAAEEVLAKLDANFMNKAAPLLDKSKDKISALILASIVQKEVPELTDQKIVAGLLKKRLEAGMPLQVDATICYIKEVESYPEGRNCYPLTPLDFKIDSPYNTYLHRGLPSGPIGNPGLRAIEAAMNPRSSSYWFYLSDPRTKATIFSVTFDEHSRNRERYLR